MSITHFGGPEKILEFNCFSDNIDADLRKIDNSIWNEMLRNIDTKIIECISNEFAIFFP